jgi:hypothetical protein
VTAYSEVIPSFADAMLESDRIILGSDEVEASPATDKKDKLEET